MSFPNALIGNLYTYERFPLKTCGNDICANKNYSHKKRVLVFLAINLLFFNLVTFSQNQFDTLSIRQVAKGVQHISIEESNVPWTLDVLKIDLAESILKVEAGISQDRVTGFERTSAISSRSNFDGHHIVGAINGGFFDGTGRDVRMQIREGEIVTADVNR